MPGKSTDAIVKIKALDKISKTLERVRGKFPKLTRSVTRTSRAFQILEKTTGKLKRKLKSIGGSMKSVGTSMTTGLTLPIAAFGGFAIKAAGDFEAAMKDVQGKTGAAGKDLEDLTKLAKKMGIETQFSANEAAQAQTFLAQAGLNTKQIITALPKTLQLAAAANLDLAEAADLSTNVLLGYGMQVNELGRLNDVMVKASNSSNLSVQELAESMKIAGPIFASQNVSLEDTVSIMGNLANAGIKGSEAGVALRKAMSSLLSPTKGAKEALAGLGIKREDVLDSKGNVKDFTEVLRQLEKRGATATDLINIFGQRAGPKLIPLLKVGTKEVDKLSSTLKGSTGTAAEIAALKMEGFNGAIKELKSAFEGFGIALASSGVLEFLTGLVKKVGALFRWLADLNPAILRWGAAIAAIVAIAGPLLIGLGSLITFLPMMITAFQAGIAILAGFKVAMAGALLPVIIIAAKIALVIAAMWALWKAVKFVGNFIIDMFTSGIGTAVDNAVGKITGAVTSVKSFFGFGDDDAKEDKAEKVLNKKINFQPNGKAAGAQRTNQKAAESNQQFIHKTNDAKVHVKFTGTPAGTKIISDSENGALSTVNTGMAGAF